MKLKPIIVAYADDHIAVRKGIVGCLEADGSIKVSIEGNNGEELLEKITAAKVLPDVCMIDINMPKMNGFALLKEIKKRWKGMKCMVFTAFEYESYIIEMIKAGANGYLLKNCDPDELIYAIRTLHTDGYYYSDTANSNTFNLVAQKKNLRSTLFSEREIELLRYVCNEMSYADIAVKMNTTYRSVDGLRDRLCSKLGVTTRIGLVMASIQLGYYKFESSNH